MADFRTKHAQWADCLAGKDPNSILNQLSGMVWDAAVWRLINEARRLLPAAPEGSVQANGMIHRLIDKCFFQSQALSIRRLTDKGPLRGPKGVYSLRGLVTDLQDHSALLARANLLAVFELPTDAGTAKRKHDEFVAGELARGNEVIAVPRELDYLLIEERNAQIDRLCGVAARARTAGDAVKKSVFEELVRRLDSLELVVEHVHKWVAHSATPESRAASMVGSTNITLAQLWSAHEVLCRAVNFLDSYLLTGSSRKVLPVAQFDHFAYIDRPLASGSGVDELRAKWKEYEAETDAWSTNGIAWLLGPGAPPSGTAGER